MRGKISSSDEIWLTNARELHRADIGLFEDNVYNLVWSFQLVMALPTVGTTSYNLGRRRAQQKVVAACDAVDAGRERGLQMRCRR